MSGSFPAGVASAVASSGQFTVTGHPDGAVVDHRGMTIRSDQDVARRQVGVKEANGLPCRQLLARPNTYPFSGLPLYERVGTSRNNDMCVCCATQGASVLSRPNTTVARPGRS